jgi:hypothetical protein
LLSSDAYFCGPLRVTVDAESRILHAKVLESLTLYDRRWPVHDHSVEIRIRSSAGAVTEPAAGNFLRCARITVDVAESGLHATTLCGARSRVWQTDTTDRWDIDVPANLIGTSNLEDVEELIILALTTGWRSAGWVPVHAAAVTDGNRCAVICAPSGGGKSTLSAAFVRRGWRTVGDDKLLLRVVDGRSQVASLQRTFNLHPSTSAWFPEVGDLERLPRYSTWTAKRKVKIESIWPEPAADGAHPTHLLRVRRAPESGGITHAPLGPREILTTLLRQVAIPGDRSTASHILSAIAPTARGMRGLDVVVGENAYSRPDALDALIGAFG